MHGSQHKVAELAGVWGIAECTMELCEGQYADQMKPFCHKTCGLCEAEFTCGDIREMYKQNSCCGNPSKIFKASHRLQSAAPQASERSVVARVQNAVAMACRNATEVQALQKRMREVLAEFD